jgi:hypothetical protein
MTRIRGPMTVLVLALHLMLTGRAECQRVRQRQDPIHYPLRHVVDTLTGNWDRVPYNPFTGTPLVAGRDGVFYGAGGTAVSANGMALTDLGAAGRRRSVARGINPYTGDVAAAAQGLNPASGARGQAAGGYNPYIGDAVAARQWYNARTGQRTSFAGSYNPMTGDGSFVGESTPGARQQMGR